MPFLMLVTQCTVFNFDIYYEVRENGMDFLADLIHSHNGESTLQGSWNFKILLLLH